MESFGRHSETGATKRACNSSENADDVGPRMALLTANEAQSTHRIGALPVFDFEGCKIQTTRSAITAKRKLADLYFCMETLAKFQQQSSALGACLKMAANYAFNGRVSKPARQQLFVSLLRCQAQLILVSSEVAMLLRSCRVMNVVTVTSRTHFCC